LLESELARSFPELDYTARLRRVDRCAIATALPKDSALVEFVYHQLQSVGSTRVPLAAYSAFVLPDGEQDNVQLFPIGMADNLEHAVALFRAAITQDQAELSRFGDKAVTPESSHKIEQDIGCELRKALIDRIRPALGSSRQQLFLSPDGVLNQLPFGILPLDTPNNHGPWLVNEFRLHYLSSGRDIMASSSQVRPPYGPPIVVANPDFNLRELANAITVNGIETPASIPKVEPMSELNSEPPKDLLATHFHFNRLADTASEGLWVAKRLGVEPWLGDKAIEAMLKECKSPRILHLATHGFFFPYQKLARVAKSPADVTDANALELPMDPEFGNPLLQCGLALAGANSWLAGESLPPSAGDGILTAEDVCMMDLLGTELVVLSACETGLGKYRAGEGVYGLRRAFELAGARSMVMSLWRVPGEPTEFLMKEMYRQLSMGMPCSEALREAQRIQRQRFPETFFWGAFVCFGYEGDRLQLGKH